ASRGWRSSWAASSPGSPSSSSRTAPSGTSGAGASPRRLLDDRLIDELLEELSVVRPLRAGRLGHEDADQLLLRIDEEAGVRHLERLEHALLEEPAERHAGRRLD